MNIKEFNYYFSKKHSYLFWIPFLAPLARATGVFDYIINAVGYMIIVYIIVFISYLIWIKRGRPDLNRKIKHKSFQLSDS